MAFFEKPDEQDSLSLSMQSEVIKVSERRLGHPLSKEMIAKIRQNKWSYMGLEMMIDTVKTIDILEIEEYLSKLD
jgi:hypothetical protein